MARLLFRSSLTSIVFVLSALAFAQAQSEDDSDVASEAATEQAAPAEDNSELVLEGVRVTGSPPLWRDAMQAFNVGDYKRAERKFRSYANDVGRAILLEPGTGTGTGSFVAAGLDGAPSVNRGPLATDRTDGGSRIATRRRGSNANVGLQAAARNYAIAHLWLGMSQIRQGELADAKRSLTTAIRYDDSLHDARMRLGLIGLLQDDLKQAERRLSQFESRCERQGCDGEDSLSVSYNTLAEAIETYKLIKPS